MATTHTLKEHHENVELLSDSRLGGLALGSLWLEIHYDVSIEWVRATEGDHIYSIDYWDVESIEFGRLDTVYLLRHNHPEKTPEKIDITRFVDRKEIEARLIEGFSLDKVQHIEYEG